MCMFNVHCPYQNTYIAYSWNQIRYLYVFHSRLGNVFILLFVSAYLFLRSHISLPLVRLIPLNRNSGGKKNSEHIFSLSLTKFLCGNYVHTIVTLQSSWFMHRPNTVRMFTWKLPWKLFNRIIECVCKCVFFVNPYTARQRMNEWNKERIQPKG